MPRIHRTPSYNRAMRRLADFSYTNFGVQKTNETKSQITAIEEALKNGIDLGKTDKEFHSDRFRHQHIKNGQTIFYDQIDDDIFMIMVGGQGWPWKEIFQDIEPEIARYIKDYKRRISTQ